MKTGTGIKRFQEDKSYGAWFQKLYEVVKTRDSCQANQAIEPTATQFYRNQIASDSTTTEDTSQSEASSTNQSNVFVPGYKTSKEKKQSG